MSIPDSSPPQDLSSPPDKLLDGAGGLLLTGGLDVDPLLYGESHDPKAGLELAPGLDTLEFEALGRALDRDMPILAICRGMQVLNVAFGGKLIQDLPGHRAEMEDGHWVSGKHSIYVSPRQQAGGNPGNGRLLPGQQPAPSGPGKKLKNLPGCWLRPIPWRMVSLRGLESPEHSWVVGVQCHPERQDEVPKAFANLFLAFAEWGGTILK